MSDTASPPRSCDCGRGGMCPGCSRSAAGTSPTYWDMIEAALTFARGQAYNESTGRMVDRALGAFDHLKKRVTS